MKLDYNILLIAGSPLDYKHTKEALAKMKLAKFGKNHSMYGKTSSIKTLAKLNEIQKGSLF